MSMWDCADQVTIILSSSPLLGCISEEHVHLIKLNAINFVFTS